MAEAAGAAGSGDMTNGAVGGGPAPAELAASHCESRLSSCPSPADSPPAFCSVPRCGEAPTPPAAARRANSSGRIAFGGVGGGELGGAFEGLETPVSGKGVNGRGVKWRRVEWERG